MRRLSKPNATFEVLLDDAPQFEALGEGESAYSVEALSEGMHALRARATANDHPTLGNATDSTPAVYSFVVDQTGPTAAITRGPADGSSSLLSAATFVISAVDLTSSGGTRGTSGLERIECALYRSDSDGDEADGEAAGGDGDDNVYNTTSSHDPSPPLFDWSACQATVQLSDLLLAGSGYFTFAARAVDKVGNVGNASVRTFFQNFDLPAAPNVTTADGSANVTTREDTLSELVFIETGRGVADHFTLASVVGGRLFLADGLTRVLTGDNITIEEGAEGLRFMPMEDAFTGDDAGSRFSFTVFGVDAIGGPGAATRAHVTVLGTAEPLRFAFPPHYFALERILATDAPYMDEGTSVDEVVRYGTVGGRTGERGIAVVRADTALGAWQYRLGGNYDTWVNFPDGVAPQRALLLADAATVRFQPSATKCRLVAKAQTAAFSFYLWDTSDGLPSGTHRLNLTEVELPANASHVVQDPDDDDYAYVDPAQRGEDSVAYSDDVAVANVHIGGLDDAATQLSNVDSTDAERELVRDSAGCSAGQYGAVAIYATPATQTYRGNAFARNASTHIALSPFGYWVPDPAPPWTLEVWVRRTAALATNVLLASMGAAADRNRIDLESYPASGSPGLHLGDSDTDLTWNHSLPLFEWAHLAFVAAENETALYVDLELVGTVDASIHLPLFTLGATNATSAFEVDMLRVWAEARSVAELDAYAEARVGVDDAGPDSFESLRHAFYFDDGCDTWTSDARGERRALLSGDARHVEGRVSACARVDAVSPPVAAVTGGHIALHGAGFVTGSELSGCEFGPSSAGLASKARVFNSSYAECKVPPHAMRGRVTVRYADASARCRSRDHARQPFSQAVNNATAPVDGVGVTSVLLVDAHASGLSAETVDAAGGQVTAIKGANLATLRATGCVLSPTWDLDSRSGGHDAKALSPMLGPVSVVSDALLLCELPPLRDARQAVATLSLVADGVEKIVSTNLEVGVDQAEEVVIESDTSIGAMGGGVLSVALAPSGARGARHSGAAGSVRGLLCSFGTVAVVAARGEATMECLAPAGAPGALPLHFGRWGRENMHACSSPTPCIFERSADGSGTDETNEAATPSAIRLARVLHIDVHAVRLSATGGPADGGGEIIVFGILPSTPASEPEQRLACGFGAIWVDALPALIGDGWRCLAPAGAAGNVSFSLARAGETLRTGVPLQGVTYERVEVDYDLAVNEVGVEVVLASPAPTQGVLAVLFGSVRMDQAVHAGGGMISFSTPSGQAAGFVSVRLSVHGVPAGKSRAQFQYEPKAVVYDAIAGDVATRVHWNVTTEKHYVPEVEVAGSVRWLSGEDLQACARVEAWQLISSVLARHELGRPLCEFA